MRPRLDLRFPDPEDEAEFTREDDETASARARAAAPFGMAVFAVFGVLDWAVVPEDAPMLSMVRLATLMGFVGALYALGQERFRGHRQGLMVGAVILVAWSIDGFGLVAGVPLSYATGGNMVCAIALFAAVGVRFRSTVVAAALLLAGFAVALAGIGGPWPDLVASAIFMVGATGFGVIAAYMLETLRRREFINQRELAEERARSDRLLHSILPVPIADRLRRAPETIAEGCDAVSVVFADVVGFTALAERLPPDEVVALLDELFTEFDALCRREGTEKIKTIGDAYMAVAGLPRPDPDHAASAAAVAVGMLDVARRFQGWPGGLDLRVGISSGPVVAGVIGRDKFAYDLWGDTVNTASRMESTGKPGTVQVSAVTYEMLRDRYAFGPPTSTPVKGKGTLVTYALTTGAP